MNKYIHSNRFIVGRDTTLELKEMNKRTYIDKFILRSGFTPKPKGMNKTIHFHSKIVGVNKRSTRCGKKNIIITTKEYRDAKNALLHEFAPYKNDTFDRCNIKIQYSAHQWRGDLDNGCKIVLDALQSANIIKNDKYIEELTLSRINESKYSIVEITAI